MTQSVAASVKLAPTEKERLSTLALYKKRSPHALMQEAIHEYLEREEKKRAFENEALSAWQDYQETGLHATQEEVMDWLKSVGSKKQKKAPICHA